MDEAKEAAIKKEDEAEEGTPDDAKIIYVTARIGVYVEKADDAEVAIDWLNEQFEEMGEVESYSVTEDIPQE